MSLSFSAQCTEWLSAAWQANYRHGFCWRGLPIQQMPEDLLWLQMLLHHEQPDCIIETGVAAGGSLAFMADICPTAHIIGIDKHIRPEVRTALPAVTLLQGDSAQPSMHQQVHALAAAYQKPLVILDAAHTANHVLAELRGLSPLVPVGGWLLVADGFLEDISRTLPTAPQRWANNGAWTAVVQFLNETPAFCASHPTGLPPLRLSHYIGGVLQRCA